MGTRRLVVGQPPANMPIAAPATVNIAKPATVRYSQPERIFRPTGNRYSTVVPASLRRFGLAIGLSCDQSFQRRNQLRKRSVIPLRAGKRMWVSV
eukprot:gene17673-biopygen8348